MKTLSFYKEVNESVKNPHKLADGTKLVLILLMKHSNAYLITIDGYFDDYSFITKKEAKSNLYQLLEQEFIDLHYLEELGFKVVSES